MKKTLFLFIWIPTISFGQWIQIGNDMDGVQANERLGTATGLNASGNIVISGAPNNSTNGAASGQARIFEWSGTNWTQRGSVLTGDVGGDNLGQSVAINDSGNIIALGAPGFLSSPTIAGYAKIFQWDGTDWIQMGSTIHGTTPDDSYGTSIALNASGSIVAIGAEPFSDTSYVRVFEWNGSTWSQLGNDILGIESQDGFGRAISLNAAGTSLAIGATNFDGADNMNGLLRVYEWNGTGWVQKGSDLIGDSELDSFGAGVAINDDGTIIAAGARATLNGSAGYVKIFEWNGTDWGQKGSTIVGNSSDFFGDVNALNSTGNILVSGTILGDYAKILEFQNSDWTELDSISGETPGDQFGVSVSMNNLGNIVAVGAFGNDGGGNQSGHVRVYENSTLLHVENTTDLFKIYPNPTKDYIQIISEHEVIYCFVKQLAGEVVFTNKFVQANEFAMDFSDLNQGIYIVTLQTRDATHHIKVIKN